MEDRREAQTQSGGTADPSQNVSASPLSGGVDASQLVDHRAEHTQDPDVTSIPIDCQCNLVVSGIPPHITDRELEDIFSQFGYVRSTKVMLDVKKAISKGFGFVLFDRPEDAARACQELDGFTIGTHTLHVRISENPGWHVLIESNKAYIRNVPSGRTEEELRVFFSRFGEVVDIRHPTDPLSSRATPPPNTAVLFVEYSDNAGARRCVHDVHNSTPWPECVMPILAKLYEPQHLRDQRMQAKRPEPSRPPKSASAQPAAVVERPQPEPAMQRRQQARQPQRRQPHHQPQQSHQLQFQRQLAEHHGYQQPPPAFSASFQPQQVQIQQAVYAQPQGYAYPVQPLAVQPVQLVQLVVPAPFAPMALPSGSLLAPPYSQPGILGVAPPTAFVQHTFYPPGGPPPPQ